MEEAPSPHLPDPEDVEDLLKTLEEAFEVRFAQSDVDKLHNVGDLYDVLKLKMGTTSQPRRRCLSAVSFYRLRKAVFDATGTLVEPRTAISDVFPARTLRSQMTALGERTGLRLPSALLAPKQWFLFLAGTGSFIVALFLGLTTRAGITALLIGLGSFAILRFAEFPRSLAQQSFGDLAREAAFHNLGRLARETGTRNDIDLWNALDFMIRKDLAFEGKIDRETRLV